MTTLADFWPSADACRDCLRTDADAASDAVALAVHQPMQFRRRTVGAKDFDPQYKSERDLLDEFLVESPPNGLVIMPIVGNSGTGKSHVIRWVDQQLRRRPDADRRLVIRVTKGRSLKGVLSDMLDQVQGERYERFREQLAKAHEHLSLSQAEHDLCENLAQTLSDWTSSPSSNSPRSAHGAELDALFDTFGSPEFLPALLRNNYLRTHHWLGTEQNPGPVRRLIAHLFEERSRSEEDDRKAVFVEKDLRFNPGVHAQVGVQEKQALSWLDDDTRAQAVEVLNAALDGAKHRLLGLDPSVNDLFREVRSELFKDEKELVLLIEDFAVLSGLQGALLQVIILDSFDGDGQVRCTMRTALAYTSGYMTTDTVLTRAKHEYFIPDDADNDDATLGRVELLVAAYLNAARVGLPGLRAAFDDAASAGGSEARSSRDWVTRLAPPAVETEARQLQAFGEAKDGTPLFPFNAEAVRSLALEYCTKNDRLVYNPRLVLSNVLLRVLNHRHAFLAGTFPPEGLTGRRLPADIALWVGRDIPAAHQKQASAMLACWGHGLESEKDVKGFHPSIAEAFGIPWSLKNTSTISANPPPPSPSLDGRERLRGEWVETLEAWRNGKKLAQDPARSIRSALAAAVGGTVDSGIWMQKRQKSNAFTPEKQIASVAWLSNASNNPPFNSNALAFVSDVDFKDDGRSAQLQQELVSVLLYHDKKVGGTWDYDGGERDAARYAAFIDRWEPKVNRWLAERPLMMSEARDPLPTLVSGLLAGARALQIVGPKSTSHEELIAALFKQGQPISAADNDTDWRKLCSKFAAVRRDVKDTKDLPPWQEVLSLMVAARQGGGQNVLAVDASRLKASLEAALSSPDVVVEWPRDLGTTEAALPANKSLLRAREFVFVAKVAKAEQARLEKWHQQVGARLPFPFDKAAKSRACEVAKALATEAEAAGLTGSLDAVAMREAIKQFEQTAVVETLAGTERAVKANGLVELLGVLDWQSDKVRGFIDLYCTRLEKLELDVEWALDAKEKSVASQLTGTLKGLNDEVSKLEAVLDRFELETEEVGNVAG